MLRDIIKGDDPQIAAVSEIVRRIAPDILVLQRVDYDLTLQAVTALRDVFASDGVTFPYFFARRPNTGVQTGLDMDGDGYLGDPSDAQSFADFTGQGGMAVLSRFPITNAQAQDFGDYLWRDLPGAILPQVDGEPFPSADVQAIQRLSTVGHWVVPVDVNGHFLNLLVFHASPPVFDGPEDYNGRRNHDEVIFWRHYLDGHFGPLPEGDFVIAGDANLDPFDSDGRREAINGLLSDDRLQDPRPMRSGEAPVDPGHKGDARLDTVNWPAPGPGALRVDYILPSASLTVTDAGVFWPPDGSEDALLAETASRHRLVWVDLVITGQ